MKSDLKNQTNIFIYALLVLILVLGFIYVKTPSDEKVKGSNEDSSLGGGLPGIGGNADSSLRGINYEEEFEKWREAIKKQGAARAYEEFKEAFAHDHFGVQHSAAHIFGEVLFDEEGIEGLTYCDSTFAFGCFHSFFGKALYVLGESVIKDMDEACLEKYGEFGTGCQHGIGHGILQYSGYDNLREALELCSLTTQKIPIFGCTSGVFMEHNVPLIDTGPGGSFGTEARELNPKNPYEPCDTLPLKFRESCYYEMGQWWDKIYNGDYKIIGNLCEGIPDQEFKHSCFLGVGNVVAPDTNYSVQKSKMLCSLMPSEEGMLACLSGSSWSFFANPDYRSLAPEMCKDLDEETRLQCAKDSDLIRQGIFDGTS